MHVLFKLLVILLFFFLGSVVLFVEQHLSSCYCFSIAIQFLSFDTVSGAGTILFF
jgi:hypothetical protein